MEIKNKKFFLAFYAVILLWETFVKYIIPVGLKDSDVTNILVIMFVIYYLIAYRKIDKSKFLISYIFYCVIVVTAAISAFVLWKQSIFDSIRVLRITYIQFLIYFPLVNMLKQKQVSHTEVMTVTVNIIRIACVVYAVHYLIYVKFNWLLLNIEPAEWGRYGMPRFYFLLIMPAFIMCNAVGRILIGKLKISKIQYYFDIFIALFCMMCIGKMRITSVSAIAVVIISTFVVKLSKKERSKYISIGAFALICIVCFNSMGRDLFTISTTKITGLLGFDVEEGNVNTDINTEVPNEEVPSGGNSGDANIATDTTSEIRDYGRNLHINSFLKYPIFGCGYPHQNCIASVKEFGSYEAVEIGGTQQWVCLGDNGIFDFLYIFGTFGIIWLIYTFAIAVIFAFGILRKKNNVSYFIFLMFLIISMYTELNWYFGGLLFFGIFLALLETDPDRYPEEDVLLLNNNKMCLVITGCMCPDKNIPVLAIRGKDERRAQYEESIRFYIENTQIKNIIYCDNSGAVPDGDLVKLAEKNGKRFECLSFIGNSEIAIQKGKGYGEGEIMNFVIENSKIFDGCDYFAKVTGRLKLLNLDTVMRFSKIYKNYFVFKNNEFVDTRFYMMKKSDFVDCLRNAHNLVSDKNKFYLEHAFAKTLFEKGVSYRSFPVALNIEGISGSTGRKYHSSKYKIFAKSVLMFTRHYVSYLGE